eukprot:gene11377-7883_t
MEECSGAEAGRYGVKSEAVFVCPRCPPFIYVYFPKAVEGGQTNLFV